MCGEQPITRSNYLPPATFLAAMVKALAKTLRHQNLDPKRPKSQGEGPASQSSQKASRHQDRAPEANSVSFRAALPRARLVPASARRRDGGASLLEWHHKMTQGDQHPCPGPRHRTLGSEKASGRPVCACGESSLVRACSELRQCGPHS